MRANKISWLSRSDEVEKDQNCILRSKHDNEVCDDTNTLIYNFGELEKFEGSTAKGCRQGGL